MDIATAGPLLIVWIAAIASPGPDLLQIIRAGSRHRSDGIWTALGIMASNSLWIIASLLGLSALISTTPSILHILQLVGGAYLTWMGIGAVRSYRRERGRHKSVIAVQGEKSTDGQLKVLQQRRGVGASFRTGIATNLSNPKAVLFFGAVFAQFIRPDMGLRWSIFTAVFLIVTGIIWFVGIALLVRNCAARIARGSVIIDALAGAIFISLGLFIVGQAVVGFGRQLLC